MTQKQIQRAAEEARRASAESLTTFGMHQYIDDIPFIDGALSYDEIAEAAFVKGANWRIESVWHGPDEEPRHMELCLIELKSKTSLLAYSVHFKGEQPYFEACFISATYDMDNIIRYAYVKDLLPEE